MKSLLMNKNVAPENRIFEDLQILLVDDDAIIQILHKKIVEDILPGLPVVSCKHGAEAIDYTQSSHAGKTHFLVLLDINMPVMNGWEFLQQCQEKQIKNISVVMVSSSINNSDLQTAQSFSQVCFFCHKPLSKKTFTEIIKKDQVASLFRPFMNVE